MNDGRPDSVGCSSVHTKPCSSFPTSAVSSSARFTSTDEQSKGQFELCFELGLRTERNGQVIEKHLTGAAIVAFSDVRWNRDRGPANLLAKPKSLVSGKRCRNLVARFGELHRALPRQEIAKGTDL